jgi:hypothetical protein
MWPCYMFTLFTVYSFAQFLTETLINFWWHGGGKEGFLLVNNHAELLLIGSQCGLIKKDDISSHGWQICQNNGVANRTKLKNDRGGKNFAALFIQVE